MSEGFKRSVLIRRGGGFVQMRKRRSGGGVDGCNMWAFDWCVGGAWGPGKQMCFNGRYKSLDKSWKMGFRVILLFN